MKNTIKKGLSVEDKDKLIKLFKEFIDQPKAIFFYGRIYVSIEIPEEKEKNVSGMILNVDSQKDKNNPYEFGLILDFDNSKVSYGLVLKSNIISLDMGKLSKLGVGLTPEIEELLQQTNYGVLPGSSNVVIFERVINTL